MHFHIATSRRRRILSCHPTIRPVFATLLVSAGLWQVRPSAFAVSSSSSSTTFFKGHSQRMGTHHDDVKSAMQCNRSSVHFVSKAFFSFDFWNFAQYTPSHFRFTTPFFIGLFFFKYGTHVISRNMRAISIATLVRMIDPVLLMLHPTSSHSIATIYVQ
mmetsp:Transcript_32376/g.54186  ORF Transcript_32376/g.54186 Transcript_32376/m.54186 type:complete len:159 (+) Transcript_32376:1362-1838(+)